jgi:hypothetical protein
MRERPRLEIEAARSLERSWDAHFVERVSCRYSSLPTLPVHPIIVSPIFSTCGRGGKFQRIGGKGFGKGISDIAEVISHG